MDPLDHVVAVGAWRPEDVVGAFREELAALILFHERVAVLDSREDIGHVGRHAVVHVPEVEIVRCADEDRGHFAGRVLRAVDVGHEPSAVAHGDHDSAVDDGERLELLLGLVALFAGSGVEGWAWWLRREGGSRGDGGERENPDRPVHLWPPCDRVRCRSLACRDELATGRCLAIDLPSAAKCDDSWLGEQVADRSVPGGETGGERIGRGGGAEVRTRRVPVGPYRFSHQAVAGERGARAASIRAAGVGEWAGVAKLVDARDLKSLGGNPVRVRDPPLALPKLFGCPVRTS